MGYSEDYVKHLPKGELHVHLNGVFDTQLIKDLLQKDRIHIPTDFDIRTDLSRFETCIDLKEYLKPWQLLRMVPSNKSDLSKLIESAFENLSLNNVKFVELRSTVLYLAERCGISNEDALRWVLDDVRRFSAEYGIQAGIVLTVQRGAKSVDQLKMLLIAYVALGHPESVVGLDFAGDEDVDSPPEVAKLFRDAKAQYGLGITIHAGETGNVKNIYDAINNFDADRIGHGTAAVKSSKLMKLLKAREICVEVCPISSRLTGAVKPAEPHPVLEFLRNGVSFVVCSDNPAIQGSGLNLDYIQYFKETGDIEALKVMFERQKQFSFLKDIQ